MTREKGGLVLKVWERQAVAMGLGPYVLYWAVLNNAISPVNWGIRKTAPSVE